MLGAVVEEFAGLFDLVMFCVATLESVVNRLEPFVVGNGVTNMGLLEELDVDSDILEVSPGMLVFADFDTLEFDVGDRLVLSCKTGDDDGAIELLELCPVIPEIFNAWNDGETFGPGEDDGTVLLAAFE